MWAGTSGFQKAHGTALQAVPEPSADALESFPGDQQGSDSEVEECGGTVRAGPEQVAQCGDAALMR